MWTTFQQLDQKVEVRGGPTGTLSNTCVTCHKRVHLVERHLVDGKLYHRSCAKSTLKENAPLRDLLQKASSTKQKPPSVTPEPSQPTSGLYSSDSSWLTTKKPPTSTPSHAPSWSTTKKQPTSSPSPAPSWSANKTQRSSSPSPVPSGLTTKKPPSSSPSPAPTWSANKTHMFSSLSPAPSRLTNETQRSRSPSPSPSCATYKTHLSNSPSPAPSGLANQTQRSSSPSPAPSGLANKTQRSSSPSPAPSLNTYEIHVSSSPSHTLSGLANKTQHSGSANPAPSGLTNQTVGTVPASTSGQTLISTSNKPRAQLFGSNTTSTTIKATLTTSPTTPLKVTTPTPTSNTIAIPTAHTSTSSPTIMVTPTPTPGKPTAAPRTSLATQRTQEAKLKFLQGNSEGTTVVGKDLRSATKGGPPGSFPRSGLTASAQGARGGAGGASKAVSVSKNQAAELISRKLAKEGHGDDPEITRKTDGVPVTETPRRGRVKLKVDRSLLADLQTPGVDPSPNRTGSASSPPPRQASSAPDKGRGPAGAGHVLDNKQHLKQLREIKKAAEGPEPSGDPAHWRSKLKPVAQNTKTSDPKSSPPGRKSPAPEICVGQVSKTPPGHQPAARPPTSGFLNGERPSGDVGTKPEPQPSKTKPHHIPKEKILEELQEIEVQLNQLETRGVELEKRLRRSEEDGEEDAAMDEVMVDWFDLITEKQMAMRRESELVYLAKAQDLEEQQPSVEQELRRLMEKPEHAKTWQERQREKELTDKLVEIVNDRNAIVDGLDEDRLREGEEDEQLQQLKMSLDIKKDKPKKKSPMSKLFGWGNNNNNNKS